MPSVLLLNQYFPPDTAVTGIHAAAIARGLSEAGFEITALVAQPSYSKSTIPALREEIVDGVTVRRIGLGRIRGRDVFVLRVAGYLRYLWGAWHEGRRLRADAVLSFHNPPFVGLVAATIAHRLGVPFVWVVQDIHPDILVATGWKRLPRAFLAAWDRAYRWIYTRADCTVVLGDAMKATLVDDKGVPPERVRVIPLWAEPDLVPRSDDGTWRSEHGLDDQLIVLYSGNMGILQPLDSLLEAAEKVLTRDVVFVLAGDGARRNHWESQVAARRLRNVLFVDYQPVGDFERMVAAADVAVVVLASGMHRLAVPSRTFALLSAGKPIAAIMDDDADIARLVRESGAGWAFSHADTKRLASLLTRLSQAPDDLEAAGRHARATFEERFTRGEVTRRYVDLLGSMVARPPEA